MSSGWIPETPINIIFKKINNVIAYEKYGKDIMSNKNTTRIPLKIITNTGWFSNAVHDWHKKYTADNIWANLKTNFIDACKYI